MRLSSKLDERTRLETWVFMVRWRSSVTPRFLTLSEKGTDALHTVTESWKEEPRYRDTIIASILSSSTEVCLMSSKN